MHKKFPGLKWFLWIPFLVIFDQVSKYQVLHHLYFGELFPLFPGFQLTLSHNHGIAFSMLNSQTGWLPIILLTFILFICLSLAFWLIKTPTNEKWFGFALMLILGGALGNLCDRFWHGYVIDFIDFYISSWHFYTFNLADSFITIGAIMILKSVLFPSDEELKGVK